MAGTRQRESSGENGSERHVTRRLVLRSAQVLEVPADLAGKTLEEIAQLLAKQLKAGKGKVTQAWVACGEFDGSKIGAIEAFAGKPGTPDAKVGEFKAPTVTSMKGGARYSQPSLPKVERQVIE